MTRDKLNGPYYRTRRQGKRVSREYFGDGQAANLAAALDVWKRGRKQAERDAIDALRRQWNKACEPLERLSDGVQLLICAVRLTARCRGSRQEDGTVNTSGVDVIADLRELVALAKTGDKSVVPRVRLLMDQHPEIIKHFGDTAKVATELWMALYVGNDALLAEATPREMVALRASIGGPVPTPLESLMVDQILICRLRLNYAEVMHAQGLATKACAAVMRELERQVDAALRSHAASLRDLTRLRKLLPAPAFDPLALSVPSLLPFAEDGTTP